MKIDDVEISQFNSIQDVYAFLEQNAMAFERKYDITNLWVKFRNTTESEDIKRLAQLEVSCWCVHIMGKDVFSQVFSVANEHGEVNAYPDFEKLLEEEVKYFIKRAETSIAPYLKSRYYHLLWKGPPGVKRESYALLAIENYLKTITAINSNDEDKDNTQLCQLFETLIAVAKDINYKGVELKRLAQELLANDDIPVFKKVSILKDMLDAPKIFKSDDFQNTLEIFEKELKIERTKAYDFYKLAQYMIPVAIRLSTKIGADVKYWYNEMGLAFLNSIDSRDLSDKSRHFITMKTYMSSLEAFGMAANKEKIVEVEKLYAEIRTMVELETYSIPMDEEGQQQMQESIDQIKNQMDDLLREKPTVIYRKISMGNFFPKMDRVRLALENRKDSWMDFFTTVIFDGNKNIEARGEGAEENRRMFEIYHGYVQFTLLQYLHHLFVPGIKSGHLTYHNLLMFLLEESWIGKPYPRTDLGGSIYHKNWLQHLAPSIIEFFLQIQAWGSSKFYEPSFVLCIDSLTLKFEGLLRDFCERAQIPTITKRKKGMQELYVHELLEAPDLKQFFTEDDLIFFKYLFASPFGLDIRNKVAHCFYNSDEYNADKMFLLISAVLRLAQYDQKIVKASDV